MDTFLLILAVLTLIAACVSALELSLGNRRIKFLRNTGVLDKLHGKVSIVVAARNEQRHLRRAVESLMAQDYPQLEVIVVNDRSTDDTAAICNNLARSHDRLKVIHITQLPGGWLGKNHALYVGAQQA